MPDSSANPAAVAATFRAALVLAVAYAVLASSAVGAQDAPPVGEAPLGPIRLAPPKMLTPPTRLQQDPAPPREEPPNSGRANPAPRRFSAEELPVAGSAGETAVQTDSLKTIDPDTAGVLGDGEGGFGIDMWNGTPRGVVDVLLSRLPVNSASPAMRDLMHRLLLTIAAVPEGAAASPEKSEGGLIGLRAQLLSDMGDLDGVNRLLEAVPGRSEMVKLIRIEADARFLANDNARACALAAGQIGRNDSPYWQKAFIFCQALAGENGKAALGVSLLRELGDTDEVFFTLIESLATGKIAVIESLANPTPLHLAVARVARAQLPADVVSTDNLGLLRTIAVNPNAPVEIRLEAAERAEQAGAFPVDALRQLYTSVSFSEEDLANPLSKAEAESGPLSRALLYRTSLVQTIPTAQAEAVARALSLAREGGRYPATVSVFMPVLKSIPPTADLVWFAPEAIRAFLIAGDLKAAGEWLVIMRATSLFNEDVKDKISALYPISRLAGLDMGGGEGDGLARWWEAARKLEGARDRAALLYSLFEAIGEPVPGVAWDVLIGGPERITLAMPHPVLWRRLEDAAKMSSGQGETAEGARPSRRAETVLLALLALGEGGPGRADPVVLRRVLRSLSGAGFKKESRALALEAAVAAGL